jgi:hypothetical protein
VPSRPRNGRGGMGRLTAVDGQYKSRGGAVDTPQGVAAAPDLGPTAIPATSPDPDHDDP